MNARRRDELDGAQGRFAYAAYSFGQLQVPPINGHSGLTADPHYEFTAASSKGWWSSSRASYGRQEPIGALSWQDVHRMRTPIRGGGHGGQAKRYKEHEHGKNRRLVDGLRSLVAASRRGVLDFSDRRDRDRQGIHASLARWGLGTLLQLADFVTLGSAFARFSSTKRDLGPMRLALPHNEPGFR